VVRRDTQKIGIHGGKAMNELEVIELARETIFVLIIAAAPAMIVALLVGLIISLFQALTQIQEATLSFVPKILAVFLSLILFMPLMTSTIGDFTHQLFERIAHIGQNDQEMEK
jgi:flagellar biosynthetic protein FliQ